MVNRIPSLTVALTTVTLALVTLRTLRASTILSPLMVILHTLTAAAHNMHLALPRPSMLLVAPTTPRVITDTTRHTLLSTGDSRAQLLSSQCGMRLLTRHQLQPLSRRIAPPRPLRQDTLPLSSPQWSLSKCTNLQLCRLTCIPACLHLTETRAWLMFSFLVRRYPNHVSFTLSPSCSHVEA
jgi:hypothetical protein